MGHRLVFEGLPAYSWPGNTISGTVVLETEGVMRATDLELRLTGREISQIRVQQGKSSTVVVETIPFLEMMSNFQRELAFQDPDHIAPGTYRLPFRFDIPPDGEPSLATTDLPTSRGRFESRPDGMYVEYELEARVDVPWWISPIDRVVIPVFSARRVLGSVPVMDSVVPEGHPSVHVQFDGPMILPGNDVTGSYAIRNPAGKELRELRIRLCRHVEHQARGARAVREGPMVSTTVTLGGRDPSFAGAFRIPLPNTAGTTGPFHGQLYRTWWMAYVELVVSLGFDVRVEAAFTPA